MTELFLIYLHFLGVVALFSLLFAQILLFRADLPPAAHRQLVFLDLAYGVAATLVLVTGLLRVFLYGPGPGHYFQILGFNAMGAAFLVAALLSFYPTRHFILRWRAQRTGNVATLPEAVAVRIVRVQYAEFALLLLALWCAVLMARGSGVN